MPGIPRPIGTPGYAGQRGGPPGSGPQSTPGYPQYGGGGYNP